MTMSPQVISRWLRKTQHRLDGPAQFDGREPNSRLSEAGFDRDLLWEQAEVRALLAASWDYSQAAGNMAIPAVYDAIGAAGPYLADRWYLPATKRDMDLLEAGGIPAFGIETRRELAAFDVVGTSISYTVLFMNFCKTLSMSGIPLRWRDREARAGQYPMVLTGGQAYCAPEFMSPVVDCVWLGEVEDEEGNPGGIGEFFEVIAGFKADGSWVGDRLGCYEQLARRFNHVYFPRFTEFSYGYTDRGLAHPVQMVTGWRSLLDGVPAIHRARRVRNLDNVRPLAAAPLLFADPGMGAGDIEVARGCDCWCVFCRLSWVTKPYRQRSVGYSLRHGAAWRLNMGSLDISLVAPDPPVHTQLKALIGGLLEKVTDAVDASSMRIDDFTSDHDFAILMALAGAESLTLGLEGNSQRMRDLAGKGTSDDEVAKAVTLAIRCGIRKIKLYMISNWPGEQPGDVMRVVTLARRLADIRESFGDKARGVRIQLSWTPLLIEAQTPLQWFEVTAPDYTLQAALDQLRDLHIDMKIGTKANPAKLAFFQACQRASRRAGEAIVDVIEDLGTASWGGFAKDMRERLSAALVTHGFANGLDDLFGERYREDLLGWEHIDTGVSTDLMWRAYRQMVELLENTDAESYDEECAGEYRGNEWVQRCSEGCQGNSCGACDREDLELRRDYIRAGKDDRDLAEQPVVPVDHSTVTWRLRLRVTRPAEFRYASNEFLAFLVRRAAYRASAATGFPEIAKRTVRLASDDMVYRDRSAGTDYIEFGVTRPPGPETLPAFREALSAELAPWLELAPVCAVLPAEARLPRRPLSLWELQVDDTGEALAAALRAWDAADEVPVLLRAESFYAGQTSEPGNAKEHVTDFWVIRDGHRVILRMLLGGRLGPYQAYAALMGRPSWISAAVQVAVRVDFFGGYGLACVSCGHDIPVTLLDELFDEDCCPRCRDASGHKISAGLARAGV
jgi:Radical SAM proteins, N-terminal